MRSGCGERLADCCVKGFALASIASLWLASQLAAIWRATSREDLDRSKLERTLERKLERKRPRRLGRKATQNETADKVEGECERKELRLSREDKVEANQLEELSPKRTDRKPRKQRKKEGEDRVRGGSMSSSASRRRRRRLNSDRILPEATKREAAEVPTWTPI